MPTRRNLQLARIFGIRIGVGASWFFVLFFLIFWLSKYFHEVLGGSQHDRLRGRRRRRTRLLRLARPARARPRARRAPAGDPDRGHRSVVLRRALADASRAADARARNSRSPPPGPPSRSRCSASVSVGTLIASSWRFTDVALARQGFITTPALALVGWLGSSTRCCSSSTSCPRSRSTADGSPAPRSGGAPATATARRSAPAVPARRFALLLALLGLWAFASAATRSGCSRCCSRSSSTRPPAPPSCRAHSAGASSTSPSPTSWTASPSRSPPETTLLDAREQFFLRYRWPWFAVVDPTRHFLGVVRQQRVESEIAAGRPALRGRRRARRPTCRCGSAQEAPLETLLGAEGIGRLGAMVAVDGDGVLQGVVTLAQVRQALRPADHAT